MITVTTDQIRSMIGLQVKHHHVDCRIVEILEDGPAIILEDMEHHNSIQADQHGEAHRRVPQTYTIPVLTPDKHEFSSAFLALEPLGPLEPLGVREFS